MTLSPRLKTIVDKCIPGVPLWDLCCDHGKLGMWASYKGVVSEVIFNDSVAAIVDALQPRLKKLNSVRTVCCPAQEISETLTGNVVIAGVGGEKSHDILTSLQRGGFLQADRIIVCPEKDAEWMMAQPVLGYAIIERFAIPHNHDHRWIAVYEPVRN